MLTPIERLSVLARAALLRERANEFLRDSVTAGNAGLWGDTIRHGLVDAALKLSTKAASLESST